MRLEKQDKVTLGVEKITCTIDNSPFYGYHCSLIFNIFNKYTPENSGTILGVENNILKARKLICIAIKSSMYVRQFRATL